MLESLWFLRIEQAIGRLADDLPECIVGKSLSRCSSCAYESEGDCPLWTDRDALSYLRSLYLHRLAAHRQREARLSVLREILSRHGLPLHWEVIGKIASIEYPGAFDSPLTVRAMLSLNEELFQHEGEGTYTLKKQSETNNEGNQLPNGGY